MAGTWLRRQEGVVETSSKFMAWWLHSIRGYDMLETIRRPRLMSFGRIGYDNTFILKPSSVADKSGDS